MKQTTLMTIVALALAAPLAAQTATTQAQDELKLTVEKKLASMAVQAKTTTGAPYSAETTTESVQVLADGNRIVKRTVTRVYRDSDGRTRTETLGTNASGDNGVMLRITISDPVAGIGWTLDPQSRTATRNSVMVVSGSGYVVSGGVAGGIVSGSGMGTGTGSGVAGPIVNTSVTYPGGGTGGKVVTTTVDGYTVTAEGGSLLPVKTGAPGPGDLTREDLGQQTIEGVTATGTRTTTTIRAGAIGNEQPIRTVSEQWFSPDLKVLVLTKYSDPRNGETTYRLSGILRTEQPRSLFEVPADYTVQQSVIKRDTR
jgi:hypothetical protein